MTDKPEHITPAQLAELLRAGERYTLQLHRCHTTEPVKCSWGSPSDPACTGCTKRG